MDAGISTAADISTSALGGLALKDFKIQAVLNWANYLCKQAELATPRQLSLSESKNLLRKNSLNTGKLILEKENLQLEIQQEQSELKELYSVALTQAKLLKEVSRASLTRELENHQSCNPEISLAADHEDHNKMAELDAKLLAIDSRL